MLCSLLRNYANGVAMPDLKQPGDVVLGPCVA